MAGFNPFQYIREQWSTLPLPSGVDDVSSKTFVVTGSNVGLGLEASVHLAKLGPKLLVVTSRDTTKCAQTRAAILERAAAVDGTAPHVLGLPLELDSFAQVRAFVARFDAQGGALHALVANAGVYVPDYGQSPDGWEVMLQVNYLSTALLSILLLPHLVDTSRGSAGPPRLVVVSSFGHYLGALSMNRTETWGNILETISSRQFGSSVVRYNVSKLLEIIFIRELAARLPDPTPVVVCTVNPGLCQSNLFRALEDRWYLRWMMPVLWPLSLARTSEQGSRTLVHATVGGDACLLHGRYLSSCQVAEEAHFVFTPQGRAFATKLWDETIAVLSRADGRVSEIVSKYLRADA